MSEIFGSYPPLTVGTAFGAQSVSSFLIKPLSEVDAFVEHVSINLFAHPGADSFQFPIPYMWTIPELSETLDCIYPSPDLLRCDLFPQNNLPE